MSIEHDIIKRCEWCKAPLTTKGPKGALCDECYTAIWNNMKHPRSCTPTTEGRKMMSAETRRRLQLLYDGKLDVPDG